MANEHKHEDPKNEHNKENKEHKMETHEHKHQEKAAVKPLVVKKDYALVNGLNLQASPKTSAHICNMIRGKKIDSAIRMIEDVITFKRAVGMNNMQVGHRHQKGIMAGRYPVDASKEFLKLLKQLKTNAIYHELDTDNARITLCKANVASKPFKRGGARAKRVNITIKLEKIQNKNSENSKETKGANKK